MTPEERNSALNRFIEALNCTPSRSSHRLQELADVEVDEGQLPKLQPVGELMRYHSDITGTIGSTFRQVSDIMGHMKQLKNRKANVQRIIDTATALVEIKRLSQGLGSDPREIHSNLESYYSIREKAVFVDGLVGRIQGQIGEVEREYQATFDAQMGRSNSGNIAELSKVLQLIRRHSQRPDKPDTLQQIVDFCLTSTGKEFRSIEEELFAVPIVGSSDSNYQFFDMAKTAMKVIVTLSGNCKANVLKVAGQEGLLVVLRKLFETTAGGVILELLMRLRKYYQVDKIALSHSKFTLKEKEQKRLQPYFKEFVAIWNQLERLRLHLLGELPEGCAKKNQLRMELQGVINSASFVEINANAIQFMQAALRYRIDKLLKTSPFVNAICTLDSDFFKQAGKTLQHNPQAQDFLEETMQRIREGIERALETLNTMVISAIINFVNHSLIYEDVFFCFNELFTRSFGKLPSTDQRAHSALLLALNSLAAFPRALRTLMTLPLPEEIPSERIRAQLQEVVHNNQEKAGRVLEGLLGRVVSAEWFRYELGKDYQKALERWTGLEADCFSRFVQQISRVHAELIRETEFSKKYTQVSAIAFEKEVRAIISHYEKHAHSILPNFTPVMDYLKILLLQDEEDFRKIASRLAESYPQAQLRRIWNLRQ